MPRLLRVSAAATMLTLIASLALAKKVYGNVSDMAVHFGDELSKLPSEQRLGDMATSDVYRIRINGATLQIATAVTDTGVDDVLARAEDDCRAHADGMAADFSHLGKVLPKDAPHAEQGAPGFGFVRTEVKDEHGYVICFANGRKLSPLEAWERVGEAAKTGEISKIGHLRYLTARTDAHGKTKVVAVWTDQPFNVFEMFPAEGDAPGSDPPNVPRPDGSRRIFTSYAEGAPAAIRIYDVPLNRADAYRFYEEKMRESGFQTRMWAKDPDLGAAYGNAVGDYIVLAAETSEGHSNVTITESRMRKAVATEVEEER